jgi:hypothetical protein
MNLTQQRFLLNRLDEAKRSKPSLYGKNKIPTPPDPPTVKNARHQFEQAKKVIADWEVLCDKSRNLIIDRVDFAFYTAKQAILFSATADAIKAVDQFERMKF